MLILDVIWFIMIVHIIMSWLINFQVLNLRQPLVAQIWDGLNRLLEPIYAPIRSTHSRRERRPGRHLFEVVRGEGDGLEESRRETVRMLVARDVRRVEVTNDTVDVEGLGTDGGHPTLISARGSCRS